MSEPIATGDFGVVPEKPPLEMPPVGERPGMRIGPYKLLEQIGEGGFGVVFMAEQHEPVRRKVALKVLKPGMDTRQVVARFEAERQALAIMDHANIAKVFDGGVSPSGRPFFVMELVKGTPITNYCDENHLTPRQRLQLFVPVCQAVQHAHQKGIIHRDLKPSNVLVMMHDTTPVVKVIDFGVAKAVGQELTDKTLFTGFAQMIGTPLYMSPEQAGQSSLDIDTRSDIYSLGVLLYELLTGTTPFDSERFKKAAFDEIRRIIREEEPPKPSTRLNSSKDSLPSISVQRQTEPAKLTRLVRGELDWIVMKCLEKDRNRRYQTANGLAMDLQRYLCGDAVTAHPPSVGYQLQKFVRRNRGPVAAAAVVGLALVAGIAGTTIGLVRARAAEANAREEAQQKEIARADEERQRREADSQRHEAELQRQQAESEKNRAIKAENAARAQAAVAQAVNHFLQVDLLGQADISKQPFQRGAVERNRDITVGELLDRAAKAIESKFARQPLTEAAIRHTVGESYLALGRYADAQPHLERSVQLYAQQLGDKHAVTMESKYALGWLYFRQGQYRRAEPLYREAVNALTIQKGVESLETALLKNGLAICIKEQGRYAEAEPLYLEVSRQLDRLLGPANPNSLLLKVNLASLYLDQEKYQEAEELLVPACQQKEATLGPNHPSTLTSKHILLCLYQGQAKYAESEALAKEIVELRRKNLGADHPDTLISKGALGVNYWGMGRLGESIPLFEEVLRDRRKKYGDKHAYTMNGAADLAANYRDAGRLDEAAQVIDEWLPRAQAELGPLHPARHYLADTAAAIYERRGEPAKAEPLLRELLGRIKESRGEQSREYGRRLASLGTNLLLQKKTEAEAPLRQALAIAERLEPDHWKTFGSRSALGGVLLLEQKYAEAEPLLLQGYEGLKQRQDKMPIPNRKVRLPEALERLVQLYEATGKKDEAAKWSKELEDTQTAGKK